jgi:hypothetical protein
VHLRKVAHLHAGPAAILEQGSQGAHPFDRKTEVAATLDEAEALQVRYAIVAVAVLTSSGGGSSPIAS